jgi:hypothetical protein
MIKRRVYHLHITMLALWIILLIVAIVLVGLGVGSTIVYMAVAKPKFKNGVYIMFTNPTDDSANRGCLNWRPASVGATTDPVQSVATSGNLSSCVDTNPSVKLILTNNSDGTVSFTSIPPTADDSYYILQLANTGTAIAPIWGTDIRRYLNTDAIAVTYGNMKFTLEYASRYGFSHKMIKLAYVVGNVKKYIHNGGGTWQIYPLDDSRYLNILTPVQ